MLLQAPVAVVYWGGRQRLPSMAALDASMCPLPPSLSPRSLLAATAPLLAAPSPSLNPNLSLPPLSSEIGIVSALTGSYR